MKQKKHSIFSISFSSVVIIFSIVYFYYSYLQLSNRHQKSFRKFPDIQAPTQDDMKIVKQLENKLPGIAYPVITDNNPVNMQIFGRHTQQSFNEFGKDNKWKDKGTVSGYSVTFAISSGDSGVCMINNKMYNKGDILPCGSTISMIESYRIAIDKQNKRRWLQVLRK